MVTVNEAKQKIIAHASHLPVEIRPVEAACGYVLARDLSALLSLPPFRQSSMDGFAVHHSDISGPGIVLKVVGESKAGEKKTQILQNGQAIRIFTGAPVPEGATAVIMQEHTEWLGDQVSILEFPVNAGKNVRQVGQQIMEGDLALPAGSVLTPGSIGFLIGMNVQQVSVYQKPKVGLLITGDELVQKGNLLAHGQVYESNAAMLIAALQQEGVVDVEVLHSNDNLESTINAFNELADRCDLILASGGVSVGDYDFVGKALDAIQAETVFYKVRQKPGKPLLFAKKEAKLFFALPGNPASSLVCYYEYVLPAIRKMSGWPHCFLRSLQMPIQNDYQFDGERDEFLKGMIIGGNVVSLNGQESFALRSFAVANAVIYLPVTQNNVHAGDMVEVHLLPS